MRLVNRHVLILCPKQPFIDWVNSLNPTEDPVKLPTPFDHDQSSVYLIPEFEDADDFLEWFKESYMAYFEDELFEWTDEESQFPKDISFEAFNACFLYSYQGLVLDTAPEIPLEHVDEDEFFDSDHDDDNDTGFYNLDDEGDEDNDDDDDDDESWKKSR